MKIKELIDRLSKEDPEMRVVVDGYETGFDEVEKCILVEIVPNTSKDNKHWEGEFNRVYKDETASGVEVALFLPRKS